MKNSSRQNPSAGSRIRRLCLMIVAAQVCLFGAILGLKYAQSAAPTPSANLTAAYTKIQDTNGPWTFHVVRIPRNDNFEVGTLSGGGRKIGLSSLTAQLELARTNNGRPIAALNGDYYVREGSYAGDPRGLQIAGGELVSAPAGTASFWIDAEGEPQAALTSTRLSVRWPDGKSSSIGLNQSRVQDEIVLYTAAVGSTTRTRGGRELVLGPAEENGPWLPLAPGHEYRARVREVREANSPIEPGTMVLSIGPTLAKSMMPLEPGAVVQISTSTKPQLDGARAAISGGPILVRNGRAQRIKISESDSYESSSMMERHPRSAVGWNRDYYFLVSVDGRHDGVSVGMDLKELAAYLVKLGCENAINLDGGGSATLWYEGQVQNRPCDGYEREVANGIVIYKKNTNTLQVTRSF